MEKEERPSLSKPEAYLSLLGDIFGIQYPDKEFSQKLYPTTWYQHYNPNIKTYPEAILKNPELSHKLIEALDGLLKPTPPTKKRVNPRSIHETDIKVLKERYGLETGIPKTFDEIAEIHKFTRENAHKLELRTLRRLRHPYRSGLLLDFYQAIQHPDL